MTTTDRYRFVGPAEKSTRFATHTGGDCDRCGAEDLKHAVIVQDMWNLPNEMLVGRGCAAELLGWGTEKVRRQVRIAAADLDPEIVEAMGEKHTISGVMFIYNYPREQWNTPCDLCGKRQDYKHPFIKVRVGDRLDVSILAHARCVSKAMQIHRVKMGGQAAILRAAYRAQDAAKRQPVNLWQYCRDGK